MSQPENREADLTTNNMRCSNDLIAWILASCLMGAMSCSGDDTDAAERNALLPMFQPGPIGAAGSGAAGSGAGGAGGGAVAGAGPGSAGAGPSSANAGAPGAAGVAGSAGSGASGAPPEGGPNAPPPAEPEDEEPPLPIPTDVGFSDVLPILSAYCTPCHATAGSQLPAFAQADADASYEVTQEPSDSFADQLISDRIVERGVVERTMPPGCFGDLGTDGCLSVRDAALLEAWVDQGAPL
jgi:hypothetical protein